ncbi:fido domain-containing protein [Powellomyces hirtus]|nr:fido domain-containing protein [Powellomyces hirtus]
MSWTLTPVFLDPSGPLATSNPPATLSEAESARWNDIVRTFVTPAIAPNVRGVSAQSMLAAHRYNRLEPLVAQQPDWPLAVTLLAETHYLMNDSHGALQLLRQVQQTTTHGTDPSFDTAVGQLQLLVDEDSGEEEDYESELKVKVYKRPALLAQVPLSTSLLNVDESLALWSSLKTAKTAEVAIDQFARNAAIQTNVLEGVFSIDGDSWSLLVKRGLFENFICGISQTSRIKKPKKIVEILRTTDACLSDLTAVLQDSHRYNDQFVQTIHGKLLKNDNISYEDDEEVGRYALLIPRGTYRRVPCFTTHEAKGLETRFCPWKTLADETKWYFDAARKVLADSNINPFLAAAWLQFAFLRIHPFADGNGRVSRIISSIPLLRANLPPVVVAAVRKGEYFDALDHADQTGDCAELAYFLKKEIDLAIAEIGSLAADLTVSTSVGDSASSPSSAAPYISPLRDVIAVVQALQL